VVIHAIRPNQSLQPTAGRARYLVNVLRDLQNATLRFEHEFFLLAQWLLLVKQARNLIKRVMRTTACLVLLRRWHLNVRDLNSTDV